MTVVNCPVSPPTFFTLCPEAIWVLKPAVSREAAPALGSGATSITRGTRSFSAGCRRGRLGTRACHPAEDPATNGFRSGRAFRKCADGLRRAERIAGCGELSSYHSNMTRCNSEVVPTPAPLVFSTSRPTWRRRRDVQEASNLSPLVTFVRWCKYTPEAKRQQK